MKKIILALTICVSVLSSCQTEEGKKATLLRQKAEREKDSIHYLTNKYKQMLDREIKLISAGATDKQVEKSMIEVHGKKDYDWFISFGKDLKKELQ